MLLCWVSLGETHTGGSTSFSSTLPLFQYLYDPLSWVEDVSGEWFCVKVWIKGEGKQVMEGRIREWRYY